MTIGGLSSVFVDFAETSDGDNRVTYMSDPKEKSGKESGQAMDERLLTVNVWGALGDSEMTGQQEHLLR